MSKESNFRGELAMLINKYSKENESNTPDYVLSEYLESCLAAFDRAVRAREDHTPPRSSDAEAVNVRATTESPL